MGQIEHPLGRGDFLELIWLWGYNVLINNLLPPIPCSNTLETKQPKTVSADKYYWTSDCDQAVRDYYFSTSTEERSRIIDKKLSEPFYELAQRALMAVGVEVTLERKHDIVVHLVTTVLPRLNKNKIAGALQYLWISAKNYTLTYIIKPSMAYEIRYVEINAAVAEARYPSDVTTLSVDPVDMDSQVEIDKMRKKVLNAIEDKLSKQQAFNTTNSVFLMLLRDYLIENDFEVRGFGAYVMAKMHLKLSTFRAISGRLGFRTRDFNEEK